VKITLFTLLPRRASVVTELTVSEKKLYDLYTSTQVCFKSNLFLSMFKSLLTAFISALNPHDPLNHEDPSRTALSESLVLVSMALEMELWLTETLMI
jgi:hypothetical protein